MSSLDDLTKNAVPPSSTDEQNVPGPIEYNRNPQNVPTMSRNVVDPRSLGEAPKPQAPSILDKMMGDLDRAIERDKRDMMQNVIAPAMEAYQNNVMFGNRGEEGYFDGEIGEDITPAGTLAEGISEDNRNQNTTSPITLRAEDAAKLHTTSGLPYMSQQEAVDDDEDDFLKDNSIYEREEPSVEYVNPTPTHYIDNRDASSAMAPNRVPVQKTTVPVNQPVSNHPVDPVITPMMLEAAKEEEPIQVPKTTYSDKFIDEAFADDDDTSTDLTDVNNEDLAAMRDVVRNNIRPVNNIIDLNTIRISSKPISAGRVLGLLDTTLPTAKWVLPATGTSIIMSALRGTEIELLANRRQGQTDLMRNQEIVQTFYSHLATDDKPASWEAWAKSVVYDDFVHLYFCEYMACFSNANFAPFECESETCKHSFMDRIEFDGMIKYKDEDAERKVKALLATQPKTGAINVAVKQVSDNVVIKFRKPTIWNAMFEDLYLPDKVRQQMRDIVGIFRHIDDVLIYDRGELHPIDTKPVAGDIAKTLKNKFKIYYDVLKSLTSDQLTAITSIINDLHKDGDLISYQYPEFKCPKCGHVTPAREEEPINILFLRHQLQNILLS